MENYTEAAQVADILSLGTHWIYDQNLLSKTFPDGVYDLCDPMSSYHPNRKAGEHTHTGDQVRFLAESIATNKGYDLAHWRTTWLDKMANYDGYIDGATKATLSSQGQEPSNSNEFAVVSRIAPIIDLDLPLEEAIAAAQSQASLTHGGPDIPEVIEFFVRVIYRLKAGSTTATALYDEASTQNYPKLNPSKVLSEIEEADPEDFRSVAQQYGQACSLDAAFPLTLYLAIHHGDALPECLSKNALAGGDNTARAMVLAMLLFA